MTEDFSQAPVSISEAKAYRDEDSTQLSPRDALIRLLREIDSKEIEVEGLFLVAKHPSGSLSSCTASFSFYEMIGAIEAMKAMMLRARLRA